MKDFRHTGRGPSRAGLLAAVAAVEAAAEHVDRAMTAPPIERPNKMSFGEQVVEAIGEHIDAKISYAETRRGPNAEYANSDEVNKTGERLQGLLDKVRFAL